MTPEALLVKLFFNSKAINCIKYAALSMHKLCFSNDYQLKIGFQTGPFSSYQNFIVVWPSFVFINSFTWNNVVYIEKKQLSKIKSDIWNSHRQGSEETIQRNQLKLNEKIVGWKVPVGFDLYELGPFFEFFSGYKWLFGKILYLETQFSESPSC